MKGLVLKKLSDKFLVDVSGEKRLVFARGNLKKRGGVFVGDTVEIDAKNNQIEKVYPRKNKLIRPPICNLDNLFIVLASTPAPDFLMLDKLILFCKVNDITPIICHSKSDTQSQVFDYLMRVYGKHFDIVDTSAKTQKGIGTVKQFLRGKTSAFAGQSGVGKSALLNAIFGENLAVEGELSGKIERGKNTTRHTQLYEFEKASFVADTAGFSSLDEAYLPLKKSELPYYYPDFLEFLPQCKFKSCVHIGEQICGVKTAVENGQIDRGRYERYKEIFAGLKNLEY